VTLEAVVPVTAGPEASPYQAPWWLPGGNAQTVWAALVARRRGVALERSRWDSPDGDFVLVDELPGPAHAPLVVLFHGLEGGADSHYAGTLMSALARRGWRGAIPHFRGCGGEANRLPRAYHSGDADEIEWILERFRRGAGGRPLYVAGVSLGGNALLKWLANRGASAREVVHAAVAVSAPLDLAAGADALERGFGRFYAWMFLRTMKRKVAEKAALHPEAFDLARVRAARTIREFDDLVTAPLHGFRDAADYYARASAKPVMRDIRVPTLVLNALNDPFLPGRYLPGPGEVSAHVCIEYPATGGHVGFVNGQFPGRYDWLPRRILDFFLHTESPQ
jgi:hypothetical protein